MTILRFCGLRGFLRVSARKGSGKALASKFSESFRAQPSAKMVRPVRGCNVPRKDRQKALILALAVKRAIPESD